MHLSLIWSHLCCVTVRNESEYRICIGHKQCGMRKPQFLLCVRSNTSALWPWKKMVGGYGEHNPRSVWEWKTCFILPKWLRSPPNYRCTIETIATGLVDPPNDTFASNLATAGWFLATYLRKHMNAFRLPRQTFCLVFVSSSRWNFPRLPYWKRVLRPATLASAINFGKTSPKQLPNSTPVSRGNIIQGVYKRQCNRCCMKTSRFLRIKLPSSGRYCAHKGLP